MKREDLSAAIINGRRVLLNLFQYLLSVHDVNALLHLRQTLASKVVDYLLGVLKVIHVDAYKLSLYKSVTVKENAFTPKELAQPAFQDLEHDVEEAATNALLKEVGHKQGKLYYAFLMMRDCYIFYQNASLRKGGKREATIVYMEGQKNSSMSMSELKRMFKKK